MSSFFWRRHLLGPLLAYAGAMTLVLALDLDRRLADVIYAAEGGHWALRNHFITADVLHIYAQRFSILLGVITLAAGGLSLCRTPLRAYRRGLGYVIIAMLTALLFVSWCKHTLPIPCPSNVARWGGEWSWRGGLNWQGAAFDDGGCFPAGHAAGGYSLLAWYFFARYYRLARWPLYLLPGLGLGLVYGAAQQLRGAHLLAHDLTSVALCWFFALFWYGLLMRTPSARRDSKPGECEHARARICVAPASTRGPG